MKPAARRHGRWARAPIVLAVFLMLSLVFTQHSLGADPTKIPSGSSALSDASGAGTAAASEGIRGIGWWVFTTVFGSGGNPQIYPLKGGLGRVSKEVMKLLVPLYEVLLLLLGIYVIYAALIPPRRAHAKAMFTRALTGLILVSLAPIIYQTFLDIQVSIVEQIFDTVFGDDKIPDDTISSLLGLLLLTLVPPFSISLGCVTAVVIMLFPIIFVIRYLIVATLGALFPAILFLYTFDYTKGIGAKLLRYAIIWIMVPVVQAFFFVTGLQAIKGSMAGDGSMLIGPILAISSFALIVAAPLMMTKMMKVVGATMYSAGLRSGNVLIMSAGSVLAGRGPEGIQSGAYEIGQERARTASEDGRGARGKELAARKPQGGFLSPGAGFRQTFLTGWHAARASGKGGFRAFGGAMAHIASREGVKQVMWGKRSDGTTHTTAAQRTRERVEKAGLLGKIGWSVAFAATRVPRMALVGVGFAASGLGHFDSLKVMPPLGKFFQNVGAYSTALGKGTAGWFTNRGDGRRVLFKSIGRRITGKPRKAGLSVGLAVVFAASMMTPIGLGAALAIMAGTGITVGVGAALGARAYGRGVNAGRSLEGVGVASTFGQRGRIAAAEKKRDGHNREIGYRQRAIDDLNAREGKINDKMLGLVLAAMGANAPTSEAEVGKLRANLASSKSQADLASKLTHYGVTNTKSVAALTALMDEKMDVAKNRSDVEKDKKKVEAERDESQHDMNSIPYENLAGLKTDSAGNVTRSNLTTDSAGTSVFKQEFDAQMRDKFASSDQTSGDVKNLADQATELAGKATGPQKAHLTAVAAALHSMSEEMRFDENKRDHEYGESDGGLLEEHKRASERRNALTAVKDSTTTYDGGVHAGDGDITALAETTRRGRDENLGTEYTGHADSVLGNITSNSSAHNSMVSGFGHQNEADKQHRQGDTGARDAAAAKAKIAFDAAKAADSGITDGKIAQGQDAYDFNRRLMDAGGGATPTQLINRINAGAVGMNDIDRRIAGDTSGKARKAMDKHVAGEELSTAEKGHLNGVGIGLGDSGHAVNLGDHVVDTSRMFTAGEYTDNGVGPTRGTQTLGQAYTSQRNNEKMLRDYNRHTQLDDAAQNNSPLGVGGMAGAATSKDAERMTSVSALASEISRDRTLSDDESMDPQRRAAAQLRVLTAEATLSDGLGSDVTSRTDYDNILKGDTNATKKLQEDILNNTASDSEALHYMAGASGVSAEDLGRALDNQRTQNTFALTEGVTLTASKSRQLVSWARDGTNVQKADVERTLLELHGGDQKEADAMLTQMVSGEMGYRAVQKKMNSAPGGPLLFRETISLNTTDNLKRADLSTAEYITQTDNDGNVTASRSITSSEASMLAGRQAEAGDYDHPIDHLQESLDEWRGRREKELPGLDAGIRGLENE